MKNFIVIAIAFLLCSSLSAQNPFITKWQTTTDNESITIGTHGYAMSNYDIRIEWGDGTFEFITGYDPQPTHLYDNTGIYEVQVYGTFPCIYLFDSGDASKLVSVEQWGDIVWESFEKAFYNAENMVLNATDTPDLSSVTSMNRMFSGAKSFNSDINNWDVSNITNMSGMFSNAKSFNQDIGSWDVSNVTDMSYMFNSCDSFNQDIGKWDVSNVSDFTRFFNYTEIPVSNYDSLLVGWSKLDLKPDIEFVAYTCQYSPIGKEAKQYIIDNFNWTFIDGGSFNYPPFLDSDTSYTFVELMQNEIIDFNATDGDREDFDYNIRYYLLDSLDGNCFSMASVCYDGIVNLSYGKLGNFEKPQDADSNNVYEFLLNITDGYNKINKHTTVEFTDTNEVPVLLTTVSELNYYENDTSIIIDINANNGDSDSIDYGILYSLPDTLDNASYIIDSINGQLRFKVIPDYETMLAQDSSHSFKAFVLVNDGELQSYYSLNISLKNVNEKPYCISIDSVSISEFYKDTIINIDTYSGEDTIIDQQISYNLPDTLDNAFFTIDYRGMIKNNQMLNFETPMDIDTNNIYQCYISINDEIHTISHIVSVHVLNYDEYPNFYNEISSDFPENSTDVVVDANADDGDGGGIDVGVSYYTIYDEYDSHLFVVDDSSGMVYFSSVPNYEYPKDKDKDNLYVLKIVVSDGVYKNTQMFRIRVIDLDETAVNSNENSEINIYPNPFTELIKIQTQETLQYNVYNLNGVLMQSGTTDKTINLEQLESGTYILKLYKDNNIITKKIIKH